MNAMHNIMQIIRTKCTSICIKMKMVDNVHNVWWHVVGIGDSAQGPGDCEPHGRPDPAADRVTHREPIRAESARS